MLREPLLPTHYDCQSAGSFTFPSAVLSLISWIKTSSKGGVHRETTWKASYPIMIHLLPIQRQTELPGVNKARQTQRLIRRGILSLPSQALSDLLFNTQRVLFPLSGRSLSEGQHHRANFMARHMEISFQQLRSTLHYAQFSYQAHPLPRCPQILLWPP